jgi:hypothetical protein
VWAYVFMMVLKQSDEVLKIVTLHIDAPALPSALSMPCFDRAQMQPASNQHLAPIDAPAPDRTAPPPQTAHIAAWGLIHSAQRLRELDINIFEEEAGPKGKDYGAIKEGDVVIFPAFGATVQEMQLFRDRKVEMVDTTCPWVAKVRARGWPSGRRAGAAIGLRGKAAGGCVSVGGAAGHGRGSAGQQQRPGRRCDVAPT